MNALSVTVLCFIIGLSGLTMHIRQAAEAASIHLEPATRVTERVHLPSECAPFYNDGTDRWINCMGVEYK